MDYSNLPYDELFQMFKERKIKYYGKSIEKQELIELLTEFDKDLPILDYPNMNCKQLKQICRERKKFYADNIKKQEIIQLITQNHEHTLKIKQQIKKEKELEKSWIENNPEKVKEYWEKFRENYGRKNITNFSTDEEKWIKNELKFSFPETVSENHSVLKSYSTSPITICPFFTAFAIPTAQRFIPFIALFLVANSNRLSAFEKT